MSQNNVPALHWPCDFVDTGYVEPVAQVLLFSTEESVLRKVPESRDFPLEFM